MVFNEFCDDSQDTEWELAEKQDETPKYYWVETGVHSNPMWDGNADHGGRFVKCYKPSVARLVAKRSGYRIYPVLFK